MRFLLIFILLLSGCKAQSQENCDSYRNAKIQIENYSNTGDKAFLAKAQLSLDSALECPGKRKIAIIKKNQIFGIVEAYNDAVRFINTLNINDFEYPYQKSMYAKYFKSREFVVENNISGRDSIIKESIKEIQNFIDKQNYQDLKDGFSVYGNLFL